MSGPLLQPSFPFREESSRIPAAAREATQFTPWPTEHRETEVARAVAEALAAMIHLSDDRRVAEQLPRMMETAILASDAGPGGTILLEQVDRALCNACGRNHGLLDGKYV